MSRQQSVLRNTVGSCHLATVSSLHDTLALLEALDLIDQFFSRVRIITEDCPVGFYGRRTPAIVFGLGVVLFGLRKMLIDAVEM
jgi:hypothetical protein